MCASASVCLLVGWCERRATSDRAHVSRVHACALALTHHSQHTPITLLRDMWIWMHTHTGGVDAGEAQGARV